MGEQRKKKSKRRAQKVEGATGMLTGVLGG
jgi:hypothetical protein